MENIVAIVGRTNVGKSTLLNRIVERKDAIVADKPGITRDRYYALAEWNGLDFTVVDTGGYVMEESNAIERAINEQVLAAIEEASVILFVVDSKEGLSAEDVHIAQVLRKSAKPVLLVANKADNPIFHMNAHSFHELGLKNPIFPISAIHGSGTGDLLDAVVAYCNKNEEKEALIDIPRLAFIGRPNVGKSTFVNALLGKKRSIVNEAPHTTRVPINSYYRLYDKELILSDTAGISRKKCTKSDSIPFYSLIRSIKAIENADVCALLINAEEGLTAQDKSIFQLAYYKKKGVLLLVNKWDLLSKEERSLSVYKKELQEDLAYILDLPILFTSGLYKKHIFQTVEKALQVYENKQKRLSTSILNKVMQKATQQNPPRTAKGKEIKMNYITQLTAKYPVFAIFCNSPEEVPTHYKRYLEKKIRLATSFEGVPVTLVFKKK